MRENKVTSAERLGFVKKVRQEHHAEIMKHLLSLLHAAPLAEDRFQAAKDIAQDVYVKLLKYNIPTDILVPIAYLKAMATNEFIKYLDRQQNDPITKADEITDALTEQCRELWTQNEDLHVARLDVFDSAVGKLLPMEQTIITMNLAQVSAVKMAKILAIPESRARLALTNARKALRNSIDEAVQGRKPK
jgi:RNA polymerase sigma factor (sigma-70 family)